jgi:hypothetical protein
MRTILLLPFLFFVLTSCKQYQYLTIRGENIDTDEYNDFVMENDTLRVVYNFHGNKGPVQIEIYNKSNEAMRIDWKRSALILDGRPIAYHRSELQVEGSVTRNTPINRRYDRSSSLIATISGEEGIEFIPPSSTIKRSNFNLLESGRIDTRTIDMKQEQVRRGGFNRKIFRASFDKESSPLVFRSYLTFITGPSESRVFTTDHSFYISEIIDSQEQPDPDWKNSRQRGNEMYVENLSNQDKTATYAVAGVGAVLMIHLLSSRDPL